ncbi:hypothetical protein GW17_00033641 [Ensete ventricosum]|nr:hypothetical protein GW17_00033641 [Ensete ventricosum]
MGAGTWISLLIAFGCLFGDLNASAGDADPLYRYDRFLVLSEQCWRDDTGIPIEVLVGPGSSFIMSLRPNFALHDMSLNTRNCVGQCEKTGDIGGQSIRHCQFQNDDVPLNSSWYMQEPLYLQWKQLNCRSDCRYYCMMQRENQRENLGQYPVKYHGKWPFKRVFIFQVCSFPLVCR